MKLNPPRRMVSMPESISPADIPKLSALNIAPSNIVPLEGAHLLHRNLLHVSNEAKASCSYDRVRGVLASAGMDGEVWMQLHRCQ